jgi:hypothetical protein
MGQRLDPLVAIEAGRVGTKHSMTNAPSVSRTRATLRKQSAWRSPLGRLNSVLKTR